MTHHLNKKFHSWEIGPGIFKTDAVLQFSDRCRDGKSVTAIHRNEDAVEYKRALRMINFRHEKLGMLLNYAIIYF